MPSAGSLPRRLLLCFFAFFLFFVLAPPLSHAQSAREAAQIDANLSPESQAVIARLSTLRELPDGAWKMHVGDVPHGEDVDLDDSGWPTVPPNSTVAKDAIWFRQTYTVPQTLNGYDLTGTRIWFQFHAYANGPMPQIIYFNGRRVALGDDLEPIVLFDKAKPGDKVVVAVKLLHTVDMKHFQNAELSIDYAENRPSPEDIREQLLVGALMVPSLAPNDPAKLHTVDEAAEAVDLKALDAAAEAQSAEALEQAQAKFDASLKDAQSRLEPLLPLMQTVDFHLTGNSHIDAAWLWPWTETVDTVKRTFGTALQLMYEYPQYTYTQSAAQYNEWLAEKYPDLDDQIKQRIKEGRWEVVGGMWIEPDLNMPTGESLVRQLLIGKRWYLQHYGVDVRVGWNPDSFGYNWQLPQIYKKSGVDYFVTQKMAWNDTNQLPFKLFWWESPDGTKILTYFPHDYANTDLNPVRLARDMVTARKWSPGLDNMMDLYGVGDHGGGPTRAMLDQGTHWAVNSTPQYLVVPKMEFGTAQEYFSDVEKKIAPDSRTWNYQSIAQGYTPPTPVEGKIAIPTWDSELYFEYHRGVFTTQANHKHNMRTAEEEVLNAEKWASLAWLDGSAYPNAELTTDWEKVTFNQFHDLAAGSGIGIIYKDAQKDCDWVRMSTNAIADKSLTRVDEQIDTRGPGDPVIVYNPLGWERSGDVRVTVQGPDDAQPRQYTLHVERVPALGYKVVHAGAAAVQPQAPLTELADNGGSFTLSNDFVSATIDKATGCITSLRKPRQSRFEFIASGACGNQLQFFKDNPKQYDAWNIDPGTYDVPPSTISKADSVESVKLPGGAPAVQVTYHWGSSKFVQTLSIPQGADIVDVDNDFDWHESHILLKAAFPVAATSGFATYEIPYGSIQRPTTRNNSWEKAQFEVPALRWADLGNSKQGVSILNKDKYGYDAVGNLLRITLLRSPKWPDPDADMGEHHFHYAIYPHEGTWKDALTVRHGWEYDYPLEAVAATPHPGPLPAEHSFASVSPDNVVLTAVKKAEDQNSLGVNGLILRVYEWAGKSATVEFHVPPGATAATVTNLMEKPEGSPLEVAGDVVKAPIKPYEILTIRVDYPNGGGKK